ncbi:MAG: hypothetical protein QOJ84_799 [Bradyrhizobium sp.]|jgi:hypothetical protein|nr:hypothetical protein [Bradyrhizobium sp.]
MLLTSTRNSINNEIPALTAIIETAVAVFVYWWIAIRWETYLLLLFGACVAPLVLLRSDESEALGKQWFSHWENYTDRPQVCSLEATLLSWGATAGRWASEVAVLKSGRAVTGFVVGYLIASQFLLGIDGWKLILGSALVAWIAIALATGVVSLVAGSARTIVFGERELLAVRGTQLAEATGAVIGIAAASVATREYQIPLAAAAGAVFALLGAWAVKSALGATTFIGALILALGGAMIAMMVWGQWGIVAAALTTGPTVFGSAAGVLLVCLAIRVWATLHYPLRGLKSLPRNFRRLWLCTGPFQPPELIPGLDGAESRFTPQSFWAQIYKRNTLSGYAISAVLLIAWFGPGMVYRFTLKSTFWVWWPLAFIVSSPKLSKTPAWQYKAMVGTLIGWVAISLASYADAVFLLNKFVSQIWHKGFPDNPFLTPLGYFFVLDWSGKFWPIFLIVGPTLSIVTLVWLNRTFAKYKIAEKNNYENLKREAERTFPIIERVQRVQFVLFIIYCLLVVGQAALYFNSQKCWIVIRPNVQSWSDWFFSDKSPHPKCDLGVGRREPLSNSYVLKILPVSSV